MGGMLPKQESAKQNQKKRGRPPSTINTSQQNIDLLFKSAKGGKKNARSKVEQAKAEPAKDGQEKGDDISERDPIKASSKKKMESEEPPIEKRQKTEGDSISISDLPLGTENLEQFLTPIQTQECNVSHDPPAKNLRRKNKPAELDQFISNNKQSQVANKEVNTADARKMKNRKIQTNMAKFNIH